MCTQVQCSYQVALGVGIPLTFLLTAIISSLLTLLITYLCLTRVWNHSKFTPSVQEPVYDPVSGTSTGGNVEMKSNMAYGHVTTGKSTPYKTVPQ